MDTMQGSRSRLIELLTFLMDIGVEPEDTKEVESAAAPQRSVGPIDVDGGSSGEDDVQWARALVKSELSRMSHAEALAVRLLLCYKELLSDSSIERAILGLLSAAATGWTARQLSFIVNTLASDVAAAAEAVVSNNLQVSSGASGVRSRSGSRSNAVTRDTAILDAILRELRPLALVARVPALLHVAVGTDADRECQASVERALEAANVNRANAETEQRCEEVGQLLAAIGTCALALRAA